MQATNVILFFRRMALSVLLCFIIHSQALSQSKATVISAIRLDYRDINNDKTLSKKTMDAEEFMDHVTDGGGELTGYYKKDSLVKIVEWVGASIGNRTREFYFKRGKLFFAFEKFENFVEKDNGELDLSKTSTTYEARYYFSNGKLIDKKITGKAGIADVAANSNAIVVAAKENIGLLKGKK